MAKIKPPPPKHVADAKLKGDREALKYFGSIGGRKSAEIRKRKKEQAELEAKDKQEQLALELHDRAEETNEHTHPVG